MEQPRKLFTFFALSLGFMILWSRFVMPHFIPPPEEKKAGDEIVADDGEPKDDDENPVAAKGDQGNDTDAAAQANNNQGQAQDPNLVEAAPTTVKIGSLDPSQGFFLEATLDSRGASIDAIRFSDPQFQELDRKSQLQIVGDTPTEHRTFSTAVDLIQEQLEKSGKTLEEWNWQLVEDETQSVNGVNTSAVFRVEAAGLEVRKKYTLTPAKPGSNRKQGIEGYLIDCEITFVNKAGTDVDFTYELQGPVGVRIENEEHARENRKLQVAFEGDDDADDDSIMAGKLHGLFEDDEVETWKARFRYVGVDNTYFAAMIVADPEQQTIGQIKPMLIDPNDKKADLSDISLRLTSLPQSLPAGKQVTHKFQFFAGPKYRELFDQKPLEASKVLNLGWFGPIARVMLNLLGFFHSLGLPYGLAIICLTVLVRGCMFPLSRKQALSAQKMKELQPQLQALKEKHGDDKEKFAKAQMELFAKNKYNPFAGCLPLVFQFPIFIGLYTALYSAIDLRLARFLWIDNLAAPDATFQLPVKLPFLGDDFSILPIVTVILFVAQQKLFMPEPTSDEQRMQYKMMNFMTIAFGFFFWHSPAGLCLYFIASSLWGITERKLLARISKKKETESEGTTEIVSNGPSKNVKPRDNEKTDEDRKPGFFERKLKELSEAANAANETGTQTSSNRSKDRRGKNKKKRR